MTTFQTFLIATPRGACAPYVILIPNSRPAIIEMYYHPHSGKFLEFYMQIPDGTVVLEPKDIKD